MLPLGNRQKKRRKKKKLAAKRKEFTKIDNVEEVDKGFRPIKFSAEAFSENDRGLPNLPMVAERESDGDAVEKWKERAQRPLCALPV